VDGRVVSSDVVRGDLRFSSESLKGKDHLVGLCTDGMISLEMVFKRNKVDGYGLGLSGSGKRLIMLFVKQGNEISSSLQWVKS
jgi:hypothetical protein